ncbi:hypothetical protein TBLA_0E02510 [Henningerozyma blattae CBS 6284]|uniref:SMP-30/Gluconolactonase/LRE-like region domain-containing protein n=1 Tax=Henningerozyma blattae (strain ATCC 34711 / CBS 6284 / DSM 70876 / NBRC 10599 / NRRL Y-10934 / UCD 77-7) TaxID=1071380 RepID=I2H4K3_HENB6|nr:hypothetical protein TBLA_0E02510 [Tetrapisispora blattae CBS 6284]CCH61305.1 hypothetical protein TBLA_0E02510 [Tetrapisispora blattae CBS 6284]
MSKFETIDFSTLKPYFHQPDARLSEGITWVEETKTLVWVDIFKAELNKIEDIDSPSTSHSYFAISSKNYAKDKKYPGDTKYDESIGVVFPVLPKSGSDITEVLFASRYGIGKGDFVTKTWEYLILFTECKEVDVDRLNRLRSNDGNVAPDGTIYVGLMNDFEFTPSFDGCVLHVDLIKKTVKLVWDDIKIPNSIHWDAKEENIFLTDSLRHLIWKADAKDFSKKKELVHIKEANNDSFESPEPDGSIIYLPDNELYSAVWSANKIQVFSMDDGKFLREYILPKETPRISCLCLVGADLFVTTANLDVENGKLGDMNGGCLYRIPNVLKGKVEGYTSKRFPKY